MQPTSRPRGIRHGSRARAVSKKVLQTNIENVRLDEALLSKLLVERVNGAAWNPGDVLLVDSVAPPDSEKAMRAWLATFGITDVDVDGPGSLLACEGATFHEDSEAYPHEFFCIQWLEQSDPWDLVFPESGVRIPLVKGTTVLFDPANIHGVIARGLSVFDEATLGDYGVQAFSSLNLVANRMLTDLFEVEWVSADDGSLDFDWNRNAQRLCHLTGAAVPT